MSTVNRFVRVLALLVTSGALVVAQHGGGGHGGGFGGGGHGGGAIGGHSAGPGAFHSSGSVGSYSHSGTFFPTAGGAFPAGVHSFNGYGHSASRYPSYSYSRNYRYGPWRNRYGYPYAYFAPFYLGTPFYGDYDSYGYPGDNGGYDAGADYDGSQQPPPYESEPDSQPPQGAYPYGPPPQPPYASQGTPNAPTSAPAPETIPPVQAITLVLNSGQTLQVQNYAIVGDTFWNLSSQPVRKIPLTAINLPASTKATEAAGAEFPAINPSH
jgi:hypothetical protein